MAQRRRSTTALREKLLCAFVMITLRALRGDRLIHAYPIWCRVYCTLAMIMMRHRSHIRVMLVDTSRISLYGLQRLIDDQRPELSVAGTATSCAEAIKVSSSTKPDVVILDAELAQENDATVPVLASNGNTRILVLSSARSRTTHEGAVLRGAAGVLDKNATPETLIKAIKKVHEGQLWLDRAATGRLFVELSRQRTQRVADPVKQEISSLTCREQEVVRALVMKPGADNKTLAASLHIGEHTLRNHLSRIYEKLGVPSRLELYLFAQQHGVRGLLERQVAASEAAALPPPTDVAAR